MFHPTSGPGIDFLDLYERVAALDKGAEETFVRFFEGRIYAYAKRNLQQAQQAEEIVQETLWLAVKALRERKLEDPANLSSYVYGIARNKVAGTKRRAARDPMQPWPVDFDPPVQVAEAEATRRQEAVAAIQELPAAEQSVLTMMLVEGLRAGDIATRLQLTEETVRQRKSRALRRIANRLKKVSLGMSQKFGKGDLP